MKSIIEEASSVVKAVEKGWIQAGKPQEFSVKILQEAEKNFLGMTTKSAKIAILFEQSSPKSDASLEKKTPKPTKPVAPAKPRRTEEKTAVPQARNLKEHSEKKEAKKSEPFWSDAMLEETNSWLKNTLTLLDKSDMTFALDPKRYYLKINFNKPLFEDKEKEKIAFRSFSYILMQILRNKFKRNLRGFKLILSTES